MYQPVLIHGERILLANGRFAGLFGLLPDEVVGRHLGELVTADYGELVNANLRHRFAGQPAAERYEVDIADPHGHVTRLELSGLPVRYCGAPALLYTAVPMLGGSQRSDIGRGRAQATLDSLSDGLVTTDTHGRIDFLNRAAEKLLGRALAEVNGRAFGEVVTVVDEGDRRVLADPVQQCLAAGIKVTFGRRSVMLTAADGSEQWLNRNRKLEAQSNAP